MNRSSENFRWEATSEDDEEEDRPLQGFPELPYPTKVIVGENTIWIDDWSFEIQPLTKEILVWFVSQVHRWSEEVKSAENREQMSGILDALESVILRAGKS